MAVVNHFRIVALLKTLSGELSNRLQHEQPGLVEVRHAADEALVGQLFQSGQDIGADLIGRSAHRFRLLEPGAAGEDGEARQQALESRIQHVVAPGDGAGQGLLPAREVTGSGTQRAQALFESAQQRLRRVELDSCRGQLDGEG